MNIRLVGATLLLLSTLSLLIAEAQTGGVSTTFRVSGQVTICDLQFGETPKICGSTNAERDLLCRWASHVWEPHGSFVMDVLHWWESKSIQM